MDDTQKYKELAVRLQGLLKVVKTNKDIHRINKLIDKKNKIAVKLGYGPEGYYGPIIDF